MKVGILGTRGIPNNYGGFEQFAEYFSARLAKHGIEVWVYNSHHHPYQKSEWNGVHIIHCFDPENLVGPAGPFIYDLNCILDSRKRRFDVILQLGYATSSVWYPLLPKGARVITNMDGLEWSRSKYNRLLKFFIRKAEGMAVRSSDLLVADSPHIKEYFQTTHGMDSLFIPYGAEVLQKPDPDSLHGFKVEPGSYYLAISRIQSDNNTEIIIKGYIESGSTKPMLLIGSTNNSYCKYLQSAYPSSNIRFLGGIYDVNILNQLRHYCSMYFHGHSSGGTNPSLLEAMASGALICANENQFNRKILGDDAFYFRNEHDIAKLIWSEPIKDDYTSFFVNNEEKINTGYQWDNITDLYIEAFKSVLKI
ncbi:MAG: DUF1972 domain-containing protein [Bacteroidales bacterium]